MIDKSSIVHIVEEKLAETEYFLVDLRITPSNEITVEIDTEEGVDLSFCAELNRYIESQLDREKDDFSLEVGSAGITQPFKVLRQYTKNIGNEVEVLTTGGKKLSGKLLSADDSQFVIEIEKLEKPEGSKRKVIVREEIPFLYRDVKHTVYKLKV